MYLKLAVRNAKRSAIDYLLYIATMTILVSIMCVSNCIAVLGNREAGFQTMSLPLLIALIMLILADYINAFMLKQRAKELAIYMLLGIEQGKLSLLFLMEFMVIGVVCFLLGVSIGTGIFSICFYPSLQGFASHPVSMAKGSLLTLAYFCIIEILLSFRMRRKLCRLQINQLMNEKRRNQPLATNRKPFWGALLLISFLSYVSLLCGILYLPDAAAGMITSFIMIPILCSIFAFYKWVYALFAAKRLLQSDTLYEGNRLYQIAELTTGSRTSAGVNTVFCVCLLLSAMCFVTGILMLTDKVNIFPPENQLWMGFLQISICIIFMVVYFSILSLMQIIEIKRQAYCMQILHYMGKNQAELKALVKTQILIKLLMPTLMCFVLLGVGVPMVNYKLNCILPAEANNSLLGAAGGFLACFVLLYLCYFYVVYIISRRYINRTTNL